MNDVLDTRNVFFNLPFTERKELFTYLIKNESTHSVSDPDQALQDVLAREAELSTGFVKGIAIPHGVSDGVSKPTVIIGKLIHPIPWQTLDGEPVNIVFLILSPKHSKEKYQLHILANIAERLTDENIVDGITKTDSADQLVSLLKGEN